MAVKCLYYNLIIPISNIERSRYKGGFKGLLKDKKNRIGKNVMFDKHLYKEGSMDSGDIEDLIQFWESQGLVSTETIRGETYWKDMCVVDFINGSGAKCNWLEYDRATYSAHYKPAEKLRYHLAALWPRVKENYVVGVIELLGIILAIFFTSLLLEKINSFGTKGYLMFWFFLVLLYLSWYYQGKRKLYVKCINETVSETLYEELKHTNPAEGRALLKNNLLDRLNNNPFRIDKLDLRNHTIAILAISVVYILMIAYLVPR